MAKVKYKVIKSDQKGKTVYIGSITQTSIYGEPVAKIYDYNTGELLATNGSYNTPVSWLEKIGTAKKAARAGKKKATAKKRTATKKK
jgi:hypothetical protein